VAAELRAILSQFFERFHAVHKACYSTLLSVRSVFTIKFHSIIDIHVDTAADLFLFDVTEVGDFGDDTIAEH